MNIDYTRNQYFLLFLWKKKQNKKRWAFELQWMCSIKHSWNSVAWQAWKWMNLTYRPRSHRLSRFRYASEVSEQAVQAGCWAIEINHKLIE